MRQKYRVILALLLFPLVFFSLILMMNSRISSGGSSSVVGIKTTATEQGDDLIVEPPAQYDLTKPGHDVVDQFLRAGGRVILLLFHPPARYYQIQIPYLLRAQRPHESISQFDPARIVSFVRVYTSASDTEGKVIWEMSSRFGGYLNHIYSRGELDKAGCQRFIEFSDPNTLYIKLEATTVYLSELAIYDMVKVKLSNPQYLLVGANVVNNREVSAMHEKQGVFESVSNFNEVRYEEQEHLERLGLDGGRARVELPKPPFSFSGVSGQLSAPHGYLQHLLFLRALRWEQSDKPKKFGLFKYRFNIFDYSDFGFDSWTPDVFTFSGDDVMSLFDVHECEAVPLEAADGLRGWSRLDKYLTSGAFGSKAASSKRSVVVGSALAVVFASHAQFLPFELEPPYSPREVSLPIQRGLEGDDIAAMDPAVDAAANVLSEIVPAVDDDSVHNQPVMRPRDEGDDGVKFSEEEIEKAKYMREHFTAHDIPDYVGGDVALLEMPDTSSDLAEDPRNKAKSIINNGGRYGITCGGDTSVEGEAHTDGRSSMFGCFGWLEDRLLDRYKHVSDALFHDAAAGFYHWDHGQE